MNKEIMMQLINYILVNEETHYEETIDTYGVDSDEAKGHIYNLARSMVAELGTTF